MFFKFHATNTKKKNPKQNHNVYLSNPYTPGIHGDLPISLKQVGFKPEKLKASLSNPRNC